jgi:succinate dehydrogenase/fumarate reductase cytochrome b subunit
LGVSTINFGAEWFDWYAAHLDKTNLAVKIFVFLIFGIVAIHSLNGLRIVFRYLFKLSEVHSYLLDTKCRGSALWYVHFAAGFAMLGAIFFHLYMKNFGGNIATAVNVKYCLQNNYYLISMIAFLVLLIFHGLYGIRIFFIKYGVWPNYRKKINRWLLIVGIIAVILGISNLFVFIWRVGG